MNDEQRQTIADAIESYVGSLDDNCPKALDVLLDHITQVVHPTPSQDQRHIASCCRAILDEELQIARLVHLGGELDNEGQFVIYTGPVDDYVELHEMNIRRERRLLLAIMSKKLNP